MKRASLTLLALLLAAGLTAGCSKKEETSTNTGGNSGGNASTTTTAKTTTTAAGGLSGDINKTLADAQKCMEMAAAYAGLFTPFLSGQASDAEVQAAQQKLEEMKGQVPANIKKDLDEIQNGLKENTSLVDLSNYLSSDKYKKASDEVTNYLNVECGKVGN